MDQKLEPVLWTVRFLFYKVLRNRVSLIPRGKFFPRKCWRKGKGYEKKNEEILKKSDRQKKEVTWLVEFTWMVFLTIHASVHPTVNVFAAEEAFVRSSFKFTLWLGGHERAYTIRTLLSKWRNLDVIPKQMLS